jgi:DNA repair ATPase RecN
VAYLERELGELRISKEIAERVLEERGSILKTLEQEITRKTENLTRWEGEVKRLENALENKETNNASLKGEFDRAREQRVDDAMLIDRLRQHQSDALGVVNEMVGKIANFVH